jgi:hypothetical protein
LRSFPYPRSPSKEGRFLHHAEIVQLSGRSFRIHDRQRRQAGADGSKTSPTKVFPALKLAFATRQRRHLGPR